MFHSHIRHSHMIFYVMQWSATRLCGGLSVHSRPVPSEKNRPLAAQLKSPFGDSCLTMIHTLYILNSA